MKSCRTIALATVVFITLTACATDDPNRRAKTGVAVGAIAGAVIGNQSSSKNGKYVGAVVGAISGAAVGNYMDRQQKKLEQQLAEERRNKQISMVRINDETLRLDIRNDGSFAVNSATLSPQIQDSLETMAEIIGEYNKTAVHIIGHTDSTGSHSYNENLSRQRAGSVSNYFVAQGVLKKRIRTAGRGETQPRFDNRSEQGKRLNRRVEIYLKSVVEGREREAFLAPDQ